jgi:hypothetical protein
MKKNYYDNAFPSYSKEEEHNDRYYIIENKHKYDLLNKNDGIYARINMYIEQYSEFCESEKKTKLVNLISKLYRIYRDAKSVNHEDFLERIKELVSKLIYYAATLLDVSELDIISRMFFSFGLNIFKKDSNMMSAFDWACTREDTKNGNDVIRFLYFDKIKDSINNNNNNENDTDTDTVNQIYKYMLINSIVDKNKGCGLMTPVKYFLNKKDNDMVIKLFSLGALPDITMNESDIDTQKKLYFNIYTKKYTKDRQETDKKAYNNFKKLCSNNEDKITDEDEDNILKKFIEINPYMLLFEQDNPLDLVLSTRKKNRLTIIKSIIQNKNLLQIINTKHRHSHIYTAIKNKEYDIVDFFLTECTNINYLKFFIKVVEDNDNRMTDIFITHVLSYVDSKMINEYLNYLINYRNLDTPKDYANNFTIILILSLHVPEQKIYNLYDTKNTGDEYMKMEMLRLIDEYNSEYKLTREPVQKHTLENAGKYVINIFKILGKYIDELNLFRHKPYIINHITILSKEVTQLYKENKYMEILEHVPSEYVADNTKDSPLFYAIDNFNIDLLEKVLNKNYQLDITTDNGDNALMYCIKNMTDSKNTDDNSNFETIIQLLINNGKMVLSVHMLNKVIYSDKINTLYLFAYRPELVQIVVKKVPLDKLDNMMIIKLAFLSIFCHDFEIFHILMPYDLRAFTKTMIKIENSNGVDLNYFHTNFRFIQKFLYDYKTVFCELFDKINCIWHPAVSVLGSSDIVALMESYIDKKKQVKPLPLVRLSALLQIFDIFDNFDKKYSKLNTTENKDDFYGEILFSIPSGYIANDIKKSPLFYAIDNFNIDLLEKVLNKNYQLDITTNNGDNALMYCIKKVIGSTDEKNSKKLRTIIQLLINNGKMVLSENMLMEVINNNSMNTLDLFAYEPNLIPKVVKRMVQQNLLQDRIAQLVFLSIFGDFTIYFNSLPPELVSFTTNMNATKILKSDELNNWLQTHETFIRKYLCKHEDIFIKLYDNLRISVQPLLTVLDNKNIVSIIESYSDIPRIQEPVYLDRLLVLLKLLLKVSCSKVNSHTGGGKKRMINKMIINKLMYSKLCKFLR